MVIAMKHNDRNYKYSSREVLQNETEKGKWKELIAEYITPEIRSSNDKLQVYVWHRGKSAIYIDDLVIDMYEEQ